MLGRCPLSRRTSEKYEQIQDKPGDLFKKLQWSECLVPNVHQSSYWKWLLQYRGKIYVHNSLWTQYTFTDVDLQLNLGFKSRNIVFTDVGFHLKSGFKKLLCSQMLVFTLILASRKYCVHQFFLYLSYKHEIESKWVGHVPSRCDLICRKSMV